MEFVTTVECVQVPRGKMHRHIPGSDTTHCNKKINYETWLFGLGRKLPVRDDVCNACFDEGPVFVMTGELIA